MIPKIIHYTWFSGEPFPERVQECIASWHKHMPDWKYILWDYEKVKDIDNEWLQECLSERKWAFASDYIRLYAVNQLGGVYLDVDCIVYKAFDSLLMNKAFIGIEKYVHVESRPTERYLTSHCFGAEAGNEYIARCLSYYTNRHFICSSDETLSDTLRYDQKLLPQIQCEYAKEYGFDSRPSQTKKIIRLAESVTIYPHEYFDCVYPTSNTFCQHLALGSWRVRKQYNENVTLWYKIRYRFDRWFIPLMRNLGYWIVRND